MADIIMEIDGSMLEGGGQVLRVALSLSAIKRIPIRITNIRAGRSKPGLMEQHLRGVELVRDMCNADVKGAAFGSTEIEFRPRQIFGGTYSAEVKTAGSITLLMQVALPVAYFARKSTTLFLQGGTNTEMAPQFDYATEVFRPILQKFGVTFDFRLTKRGYFPRGGGEVTIRVEPKPNSFRAINLTNFGKLKMVYGWAYVAGLLPIKVANMMAYSAIQALGRAVTDVNIERYKEKRDVATDNGSGIILVAETDTGCIIGGSAIGKKNEEAQATGKRAAEELLEAIKVEACVDSHCQDQLIIFMALANGPSRIRVGEVTMHTKTAIALIEQMTPVTFEIIPEGATNIIICSGDIKFNEM